MKKISFDQASKEVADWLDFKKIGEKKREAYEDQIEVLTYAVHDGVLSLKPDTKDLIHKLKFPLEGETGLSELLYKPRLAVRDIRKFLKGVKPNDPDGRVAAYCSALTGQTSGIINALDTEDYSVASAVAIFFI